MSITTTDFPPDRHRYHIHKGQRVRIGFTRQYGTITSLHGWKWEFAYVKLDSGDTIFVRTSALRREE